MVRYDQGHGYYHAYGHACTWSYVLAWSCFKVIGIIMGMVMFSMVMNNGFGHGYGHGQEWSRSWV